MEAMIIGFLEGMNYMNLCTKQLLIIIDCNVNAIHTKKVTIMQKDARLAKHYYNKYLTHGNNTQFRY